MPSPQSSSSSSPIIAGFDDTAARSRPAVTKTSCRVKQSVLPIIVPSSGGGVGGLGLLLGRRIHRRRRRPADYSGSNEEGGHRAEDGADGGEGEDDEEEVMVVVLGAIPTPAPPHERRIEDEMDDEEHSSAIDCIDEVERLGDHLVDVSRATSSSITVVGLYVNDGRTVDDLANLTTSALQHLAEGSDIRGVEGPPPWRSSSWSSSLLLLSCRNDVDLEGKPRIEALDIGLPSLRTTNTSRDGERKKIKRQRRRGRGRSVLLVGLDDDKFSLAEDDHRDTAASAEETNIRVAETTTKNGGGGGRRKGKGKKKKKKSGGKRVDGRSSAVVDATADGDGEGEVEVKEGAGEDPSPRPPNDDATDDDTNFDFDFTLLGLVGTVRFSTTFLVHARSTRRDVHDSVRRSVDRICREVTSRSEVLVVDGGASDGDGSAAAMVAVVPSSTKTVAEDSQLTSLSPSTVVKSSYGSTFHDARFYLDSEPVGSLLPPFLPPAPKSPSSSSSVDCDDPKGGGDPSATGTAAVMVRLDGTVCCVSQVLRGHETVRDAADELRADFAKSLFDRCEILLSAVGDEGEDEGLFQDYGMTSLPRRVGFLLPDGGEGRGTTTTEEAGCGAAANAAAGGGVNGGGGGPSSIVMHDYAFEGDSDGDVAEACRTTLGIHDLSTDHLLHLESSFSSAGVTMKGGGGGAGTTSRRLPPIPSSSAEEEEAVEGEDKSTVMAEEQSGFLHAIGLLILGGVMLVVACLLLIFGRG